MSADTDIVQKIFGVDKEKAEELIEKGLDVEFLQNGYSGKIREELGDISNNFKKKADDIIKEEKSN